MDTSTGRFISMDTYQGSTADPISLHKYLYANSNPITYSDASGYCTLIEAQAIMVGIAAVGGIIALDALGIFHKLTDGLIGFVDWVYDFVEQTIDDITDIASGTTTSAEANAEVRDKSVDGVPGKESDDEQDDDTSVEEPDGNDLEGPPNQTLPRTNKDGEVIGDRTYGSDGKADVDTDYTDHGNPKQHPKVPHKHKWDWSNPNKPKRLPWDY